MSFSANFAGPRPAVLERIAQPKEGGYDPFAHGGELGALTKEYLGKVAALVGEDKTLVVESSGHADTNTLSLNVKVVTVHGM